MAQYTGKWKAVVHAVKDSRIPKNAGMLFSNGEAINLPRITLLHGISYVRKSKEENRLRKLH